jgi:hypothetical protein
VDENQRQCWELSAMVGKKKTTEGGGGPALILEEEVGRGSRTTEHGDGTCSGAAAEGQGRCQVG